MNNKSTTAWLLRFLKGILIGSGFILPGVSGGALAAIFGLYERMVSFMAHLTEDFKNNALFFLPVGLGMIAGIILLAYPLSYLLANYPAPTMWCFIGCIIGTFPSLWTQAGKNGRQPIHFLIIAVSAITTFLFLQFGIHFFNNNIVQNFYTWLLAGAIIALGVLIPGLSPSNFLLYMGMYASMVTAFKTFDLLILIPIAIGGLGCMLLLSKAIDWLFQAAYAGLFHIILGIVIASTLIIVPVDFNYLSLGTLICLLAMAAGMVLGHWMSHLEEQYKPEH